MKRWLLARCIPRPARRARRKAFPSGRCGSSCRSRRAARPTSSRARIAQGLQAVWPQPVVVENRPGGSQNIGADLVAKSAPDGYTWLLAPDNVFSVNPHLGKQPFDPFNDLAPVTQVARIQFLLVVPPSVPANSVQELIAYAKARPGELNYGSSGNGSPQHLGARAVQLLAGIEDEPRAVQGRGAGGDRPAARPHPGLDRRGELAAAAHQGRQAQAARQHRAAALRRSSATRRRVAEAGVPGYALDPWLGLFMPAKTPQDVVMKAHGEIVKILSGAELKARLGAQGIELVTNSPADFARFVREDNARWGKLIKEAGIKGE